MTHLSFRLSALVLLCLGAHTAHAEEWLWPDGKLAVQQPPVARFTKDPSVPPPGVARWVAADQLTVVAFIQTPNPSDLPLEQSGLEEGTLNQFPQGKVVSSSQSTISGIPAYTIVASRSEPGGQRFIAQSLVTFNGQLYKVLVASPNDPLLDADLGPILRSLRIIDPSPRAPGPTGARQSMGGHDLSVTIGEWGFWFLLAALAVALLRKRRPSRPAQS